MDNPFTISVGEPLTIFIGRKELRERILDVILFGKTEFQTTLIKGVRGIGKTVLSREIITEATKQGAHGIFIPAMDFDKLEPAVLNGLAQWVDEVTLSKITFSINLGIVSTSSEFTASYAARGDLYTDGKKLLDALHAKNKWIIIAIDEVQAHVQAIADFVATYQQWLGDGYKVMLIMNGVADEIDELLTNKSVTFMRRAKQAKLVSLNDFEEIANVYQTAFSKKNVGLSIEKAKYLAKLSKGYPYAVQLIGYFLWEQSNSGHEISNEQINQALVSVKSSLNTNVYRLMLSTRSPRDIDFLKAMIIDTKQDTDIVESSAVIEKLNADNSYYSQYRNRLIEAGLIKSVGYGKLAFVFPWFDEYLLRDELLPETEEFA
ncbi:MAG: ATP-binding protein [Lactobacillaceae bacterium]|jgi:hypothetical protein|nr:ATP-binding protein [Lactobacillaceae bacterium]